MSIDFGIIGKVGLLVLCLSVWFLTDKTLRNDLLDLPNKINKNEDFKAMDMENKHPQEKDLEKKMIHLDEIKLTEEFIECKKPPIYPQDRRINKNKLKIMTFNTNFLVLKKSGKIKCPGSECKWKTNEDAMNHMKAIANILINLDADIIQLAETGDCETLNILINIMEKLDNDNNNNDNMKKNNNNNNKYYPYIIKGTDDFTGQNVALITRIDPFTELIRTEDKVKWPLFNSKCSIRNNKNFRKSGARGVSKHFSTRFKIVGYEKPITLIGLHLLAQPFDEIRCYEREAQAVIVSNMIKKAVNIGDSIIVLGDFNDFDTETRDINNNIPISRVLKLIRDAGSTKTTSRLINIGMKVPKIGRYTSWRNEVNDGLYKIPSKVSQMDHILVSSDIYKRITNVKYGTDLFTPSKNDYYSDHFPIIATIT